MEGGGVSEAETTALSGGRDRDGSEEARPDEVGGLEVVVVLLG